MQRVNILPADLAPSGLSAETIILVRKCAMGLGILLFLCFLPWSILRFELARERRILNKITGTAKEWGLLAGNVEALKKKHGALKQELDDINKYLSAGLVCSKKLRQISVLMPRGVSLSRIAFRGNSIELKGSLLPQETVTPINALSNFVNKIKQDKEFFVDFSDLLMQEARKFEKAEIAVVGDKDIEDFLADRPVKVEKVKADVMAFEISLVR